MARRKTSSKNTKTIATIIAVILVLIVGALDYLGVINLSDEQTEISVSSTASDAENTVSFVDVGQGNCTLAVSGDCAILIDAGETDKGEDVVSYLEAMNVTKLDYIIISHQHTDHMGGMIDVLNSDIEVGKIIMPEIPEKLTPTSYTYTNLLTAIEEKGLSVRAARDEQFEVGDFTVSTFAMEGDYSDLNNYSVVTKIETDAGNFIIMGDLETTAEKELLSKDADLSADVILVGHHGSSSSSSDSLLESVNPSCAVISVGADNSYGHPNDATIERIENYTDSIYRTDLNGTIVFDCDGTDLSMSVEKSE